MATYYINRFNTGGGVYPYTRPEDGAKNFYELITNPTTKIQLQHDDQIRLYNPCPGSSCIVDDSYFDIEFNKRVTILSDSPNNGIIIKLKSDGRGLKFYSGASNSVIKGLRFTKDIFDDGSIIYAENVISFSITKCEFIASIVTANSIAINLNSCQHALVSYSYIEVPIATLGYGIKLENCQKCKIEYNGINLKNNTGYGISYDANEESFGNYIGANVIYNMGDDSIGINFDGKSNMEDIKYNVIHLAGANTYGIVASVPVGFGHDINIKNNVFIIEDDASGIYGIYIPDFGVNNTSNYEITNNIFHNTSADYYKIQNAIAMNVDVNKFTSEIDYNLFYGFESNNIFNWTGNPNTLSAMGDRTYVDLDPQLLYYYDDSPPLPYSITAVGSFNSSASSQVIGAGKNHEHIGIYNQESNLGYNYCNFIDTVTHELGIMKLEATGAFFTFFNNAFTESIDRMNLDWRTFYTSGDNYENQFSWVSSAAEDFPFTFQNHMYDKKLLYVIKNKDELEPFDGVFCPANPGYNFSDYSGYDTGIFGFSRAEYINTCIAESCIIQDDVNSDFIWIDDINAVYIVQDTINPQCVDDTPVSPPMEY